MQILNPNFKVLEVAEVYRSKGLPPHAQHGVPLGCRRKLAGFPVSVPVYVPSFLFLII